MTYLQMGEPERALEPIEAAIGHSGGIGDATNLAKAILAKGDALAALGRPAEAEAAYREAIERSEGIPAAGGRVAGPVRPGELALARGDRGGRRQALLRPLKSSSGCGRASRSRNSRTVSCRTSRKFTT
jgi:tetratricopeptide (TPR) repeat protein